MFLPRSAPLSIIISPWTLQYCPSIPGPTQATTPAPGQPPWPPAPAPAPSTAPAAPPSWALISFILHSQYTSDLTYFYRFGKPQGSTTRDSRNFLKAIPLTSLPCQRSSQVITGYQRSSTVIYRHQRLSTVISGDQRLSTVINVHQRSSTVINSYQRSSTTINGHQRSSTVINDHQ